MHVGASGERVWYVAKARLGRIWVALGCGAVWVDSGSGNDMGQALDPLGVHWLMLCRLASAMAARWVCMWIRGGTWRHIVCWLTWLPSSWHADMALDVLAVWEAPKIVNIWQKVRSRGSYTAKCRCKYKKNINSTRETELKIMNNICLGEITQLHNTIGVKCLLSLRRFKLSVN